MRDGKRVIGSEQLTMDNKKKYKKTEIGEIPVEWEVKAIVEVAEVVSGGTPDTNRKEFWEDAYIPWATPTDITFNGKYIAHTEKNITEEGLKSSSANLLPIGSILMTSRATIGEKCINTVPMATNQGFKSLICKENLFNEFMYYLIDVIKPKFVRLASGSTFLELSKKEVENFKIPVPSLKEQQKIAAILSTVDEYIEQTDVLIEKTKELKKGLMQKLLTKGIGHTEFKKTEIGEIPKEWEVIPLFDTGEYINGRAFKPSEWTDRGVPIIRIQNLNDKSATYNYCNLEIDEKYHVYKGDLLFAWSGSIGLHRWNGEKAYLNQHIYKVIPNKNIIKDYLYYQLSRQIEILLELSHGSTMKHITRKNLKLVKVAIPNIEEQQKIASILSEVDNQIEYYENKKEKLQNLKKGLMQKLLTGKIRVKI
ncbi:type I restriction enzyme, S subunit [Caloranaerobacter azorensis DSM 13643]|uniref:Type I restriction enzyme, S subunit n=1 Tax=Caloranaerobacter azorensis DSM 13643 TaxID=1121264 RepID=A0A1M5UII5_9FIRM|nr:restriction endonuclease subunit S [Caloranaerobacter azorensis]SHH62730.1 type I restriction enzyme, S subunit [Caloranaerobacter azorensis DSM 13643]